MGGLGSWMPETVRKSVHKNRRSQEKATPGPHQSDCPTPRGRCRSLSEESKRNQREVLGELQFGESKWSSLPVRVAIPKRKSGSCVRAHLGVFLVATTGGVLLNPKDRGSGKLLDSSEHTAQLSQQNHTTLEASLQRNLQLTCSHHRQAYIPSKRSTIDDQPFNRLLNKALII